MIMEIEEVLEKIDEQYEKEAFEEFRRWLVRRGLHRMNREINKKNRREGIIV